ncbi:MAG TPA: FkbM family methyltransferase [bacterium]|nr:FkbM family methyltransferase [bacterium]
MKRPVFVKTVGALARMVPWKVRVSLDGSKTLRRPLRRLIESALPDEPAEVTVAGGALEGAKMILDLRREKYLWLGTHEVAVQKILADLLSPADVVYDVGAYVGFFTLLAGRLCPRGRCLAFEPNPASFRRLQANLELNRLENCQAFNLAVGDREGDADFRPEKNRSPLQGHLVEPDYALGFRTPPVPPIRVRVVSLDGFVYREGHPAPGLIKVDVEGGELKALAGMRRVLAEARPALVCEVHSTIWPGRRPRS